MVSANLADTNNGLLVDTQGPFSSSVCKVQWSHRTEEEATCEREEELKAEFSSFFSDFSESRWCDSF
jgi:hypothetical protein